MVPSIGHDKHHCHPYKAEFPLSRDSAAVSHHGLILIWWDMFPTLLVTLLFAGPGFSTAATASALWVAPAAFASPITFCLVGSLIVTSTMPHLYH